VSGTVSFIVTCASVATIFAILATALNVQYGVTGLANFGLVGFFGFGAFATGLLILPRPGGEAGAPTYILGFDLPWPIAAVLAAIATAVFAGLVAYPAIRARLDEAGLGISVLAASLLLFLFLSTEDRVANGFNGLRGFERPFAEEIHSALGRDGYAAAFLVLALALLALCTLVMRSISSAPAGRVLRAMREDPPMAAALGHSIVGYQLRAFMLGGAISGLAGSLWTIYARSVAPQAFLPELTFIAFAALIIGGSGSMVGPLLGAAVVVGFVMEGTRFLPDFLGPQGTAALRPIVIGVCLILVLRFRPEGLWPERLRRFERRGDEAATA
jgi:branched-chain amino acid transport system permease protein